MWQFRAPRRPLRRPNTRRNSNFKPSTIQQNSTLTFLARSRQPCPVPDRPTPHSLQAPTNRNNGRYPPRLPLPHPRPLRCTRPLHPHRSLTQKGPHRPPLLPLRPPRPRPPGPLRRVRRPPLVFARGRDRAHVRRADGQRGRQPRAEAADPAGAATGYAPPSSVPGQPATPPGGGIPAPRRRRRLTDGTRDGGDGLRHALQPRAVRRRFFAGYPALFLLARHRPLPRTPTPWPRPPRRLPLALAAAGGAARRRQPRVYLGHHTAAQAAAGCGAGAAAAAAWFAATAWRAARGWVAWAVG